jgi:hypothetical protein
MGKYNAGSSECGDEPSGFINVNNFLATEDILASQEGLCSLDLGEYNIPNLPHGQSTLTQLSLCPCSPKIVDLFGRRNEKSHSARLFAMLEPHITCLKLNIHVLYHDNGSILSLLLFTLTAHRSFSTGQGITVSSKFTRCAVSFITHVCLVFFLY